MLQMESGSEGRHVNLDDDIENLTSCEAEQTEQPSLAISDGLPKWLKTVEAITGEEIMRLQFDTEDAAIQFYQSYARCHGFAVRKDDVGRDLNGNINMRVMVCNREGLRKSKKKQGEERLRNPKPITRTKCQARIRVVFDSYIRKWKVTAFEEAHNHELTELQYMHLIPQYRSMSDADKAQADMLHRYGVKTRKIMGIMIGQAGGHAKVGFTKKDLQNFIDGGRRDMIAEGDANAVISYLAGKSKIGGGDRWNYTTTDDQKLKNFIWTDGISQLDYQCFGDVLAFDTTYKRNKYNKPLVILSGCNHHRQTVIFGFALVENETAETYKWVLKEFMAAMGDKEPKGVVTDGDGAMRDAIREIFPGAVHRLCAWHIFKNASDNIKNKACLEEFRRAIYEDMNVDKFKKHWDSMVDKYGLKENRWMNKMYESKDTWAQAYMRGKFFARMRTTSQCEGINSFINDYVGKKQTLIEFVKNFERAVSEYRNNELMADYKSLYTEPVMSTPMLIIEEEAANVFTRAMYIQVKEQIEFAGGLNIEERLDILDIVVFKLTRYGDRDVMYEVVYEKGSEYFRCVCGLFENVGIPCSHIFAAMKRDNVTKIPPLLISERWTKTYKSDHITTSCCGSDGGELTQRFRVAALSSLTTRLCHLSSKNGNVFKQISQQLTEMIVKMELNEAKVESVAQGDSIGDPNIAKTKGAPPKRDRGSRRKSCSHCGREGHNIRR